jgi:hypothetical protein
MHPTMRFLLKMIWRLPCQISRMWVPDIITFFIYNKAMSYQQYWQKGSKCWHFWQEHVCA